MWDLPGPGLEPVSPALAGGFLTTVPPGKLLKVCFVNRDLLQYFCIESYFLESYSFTFIITVEESLLDQTLVRLL